MKNECVWCGNQRTWRDQQHQFARMMARCGKIEIAKVVARDLCKKCATQFLKAMGA